MTVTITKVESIRDVGHEQYTLWVEVKAEDAEPVHVSVSPAALVDPRQLQAHILRTAGLLWCHPAVEGRSRAHGRETWMTYLATLMQPPIVLTRPPAEQN